jgi:hypothetical protein
MLASEKVRWSLHTVRSRLAKKQQYCQFFTRFGECKKSGGNCPYIHDQAKVAICTKFLKGLCSNATCKLTHKVRYFFLIPLFIVFLTFFFKNVVICRTGPSRKNARLFLLSARCVISVLLYHFLTFANTFLLTYVFDIPSRTVFQYNMSL